MSFIIFIFLVCISPLFRRIQITSLCRRHTNKINCSQALCFKFIVERNVT